ncbi:GmrSD restriction endonuclease domain-containing protein [Cellulomonas soli]|uniref:Excalibur calcium-binding domain-containing protein n=1 Tax=Cellulomonas soli TaxID=931535 RepID=A0A512P9H4_9CELL|nr:DUF1524 domain-containing protein [Cellulomonas soli]GEP67845.1 hypothetical protein CSO01_05600 [Cellulomonas soli]
MSPPAQRPWWQRPANAIPLAGNTLLFLFGLVGGLGGALVMLGIGLLLGGLWHLLTGKPLPGLRLRGRRWGAALTGLAFVVTLTGGSLLPPSSDTPNAPAASTSTTRTTAKSTATPTPTPTPTEDVEDDEVNLAAADTSTGLDTTAGTAALQAAIGQSALVALAELTVDIPTHAASYDRDAFGYRAYDTDHNGCDVRNDVLARDLTDVTYTSGNCKVATGTLNPDPYSGKTTAFTSAASTLDIDHVVSLGDAWISGAWAWDADTQHQFGNDPMNTLAVDSGLNRAKSNDNAARWLPPNTTFDCQYVAIQIGVKYTYGLTVTQAEKDTMASVLAGCPDQPLPEGSALPTAVQPPPAPVSEDTSSARGSSANPPAAAAPATEPEPAAEPAPAAPAAPAPVGNPGDSKNCGDFATWADANAWFQTYLPAYGDVAGLDADNDGIPCESLPGAP